MMSVIPAMSIKYAEVDVDATGARITDRFYASHLKNLLAADIHRLQRLQKA